MRNSAIFSPPPLPFISVRLRISLPASEGEGGKPRECIRVVHYIPTRSSYESEPTGVPPPPPPPPPNKLLELYYSKRNTSIGDGFVEPKGGILLYFCLILCYIFYHLFPQPIRNRLLLFLSRNQPSPSPSPSPSSSPTKSPNNLQQHRRDGDTQMGGMEIEQEWEVPLGTNEAGAKAVLLGFSAQKFMEDFLEDLIPGIEWKYVEDVGSMINGVLSHRPTLSVSPKCPKLLHAIASKLNLDCYNAVYTPQVLMEAESVLQDLARPHLVHIDPVLLPYNVPVEEDSHNLQFQEVFYAVQFYPQLSLKDRLNVSYSCKMCFRILHASTITKLKLKSKGDSNSLLYDDVETQGLKLLHVYAARGNTQALKIALGLGLDKNGQAGEKRQTPLHLAAAFGHESVLRLLAFYGANIDAQDAAQNTVLHLATNRKKYVEIVHMLLHLGARVNLRNKRGETAASCLVPTREAVEMFKEFIMCGADLNIKDNSGVSMKDLITRKCTRVDQEVDALLAKHEDTNTLLFNAVRAGDLHAVRRIAAQHAHLINIPAREGLGPLHVAAQMGQIAIMEELIKKGAKVDMPSSLESAQTPLHVAAAHKHLSVGTLLRAGAQIEARDAQGRTPLHWAVWRGTSACVREVLHGGANVNARDSSENTPLHFARDAADTKLLLEHGASPALVNLQNANALHQAAQGQADVMEELLKDPRARELVNSRQCDGKTPLHLAANWGSNISKKMVQLLLENGAEADARSAGTTPLILATKMGRKEVVRRLLDAGANVNTVDDERYSPLLNAVLGRNEEVVKMVLSKGANVHDLHGLLVFSTAVISSSVEIVEILIDHGAAVDYACGFGNTPLHYAVIHKRAEVVEKLLLKGVNINHENLKGQTPLNRAAHTGDLGVIELLLKNKAQTDVRDKKGNTPLHRASKKGRREVVKRVAKEVRNINEKNEKGETPLYLSSSRGHVHVVKEILQRGGKVDAATLLVAATKGYSDVVVLLMNHSKNVDCEGLAYAAEKAGHVAVVVAIRKWQKEKDKNRIC